MWCTEVFALLELPWKLSETPLLSFTGEEEGGRVALEGEGLQLVSVTLRGRREEISRGNL